MPFYRRRGYRPRSTYRRRGFRSSYGRYGRRSYGMRRRGPSTRRSTGRYSGQGRRYRPTARRFYYSGRYF